MVFAINCGANGAPNSFTNFQKAALAVGASLSAAAAATASATPSAAATSVPAWTTAAYGDYTIPAAPAATPVTATVSAGSQVWTTTYASYPNSPAATPASAQAAVHTVVVGGTGILAFNPPSIAAQPQDTIVFQLYVNPGA